MKTDSERTPREDEGSAAGTSRGALQVTSCPQKLGERRGIDSLAEHLTSRSVRNKLLLSCAAPFVAFVVTAPGIRDMLPLTRPLSSPP